MLNKNIFLVTGSNLGNRLGNLNKCVALIDEHVGHVVRQSSVYETAAWGKTDQDNFLNQALELESTFSPEETLARCLAIEEKLGRIRREQWGTRNIDVDIIYFDRKIMDTGDLIIPHPRMADRKFVLVPLHELSPTFIHPVFHKTNAALLQECTDPLEVKLFAPAGH